VAKITESLRGDGNKKLKSNRTARPSTQKTRQDISPPPTGGQKFQGTTIGSNNPQPKPDWMVRFTGGLLAIGFVTAFIIGWQSILMRQSVQQVEQAIDASVKANNIGRDTMEGSLRPWISVDVYPASDFIIMSDGTPTLSVNLKMKNYGPSPALEVAMMAVMFDIGSKKDFVEEQVKLCQAKKPFLMPMMRDSIFPTQTVDEYFGLRIEAANNAPQKDKRETDIWMLPVIVGCVEYVSPTTKTKYQTGFVLAVSDSRKVTPGTTGGIIALNKGGRVPQESLRLFVVQNTAE
jgi:hypothetical protein